MDTSAAARLAPVEGVSVQARQRQIEEQYDRLLQLGLLHYVASFIHNNINFIKSILYAGNQRRTKLEESTRAYQLVREANELAHWIVEKETIAITEMQSESLEQVEDEQKKFEQFQTEMKSNEEKLKKLNEVAEKLQEIGQTEAAEKIIQQIETLNTQWSHLEQTATEKANVLVSSHEVHLHFIFVFLIFFCKI